MEKLNVAIADDNERMTDILGQMIEEDKELTLVGKAHNGEEICNIIREKEPDVVVLDVIMPKMDGLTVMEQCSHDQTVKKQPAFISPVLSQEAYKAKGSASAIRRRPADPAARIKSAAAEGQSQGSRREGR